MLSPICLFLVLCYSSIASGTSCLTQKQQLQYVDEWGYVAKIIDGDTFRLKDGRSIRIIGINTPEIGYRGQPSQAFAKKARRALSHLLDENKRVGLTYDRDKKDRYGRTLAYVNVSDGRSVEEILLAKGLARALVIPPNDARIQCYHFIEQRAQKQHLGIWQLPENQWLDAALLDSSSKGYFYIQGVINHYGESHKSIYLTLTAKLSIRIAKKDRKYFPQLNLKTLVGQRVYVRGWVNIYNGQQSIHIRTRYDLSF